MLVGLAPINPPNAVDAVEFPSLEETCVTILSHNVRDKAAQERQWRMVPGATGPIPTPQAMKSNAQVDDDDAHIPLQTSQVCPMFASIVTQKAVHQHQHVTHTGAQARAIQGRSKAGHLKPTSADQPLNVTYATVIQHSGLPDKEAEHALHTKPTHFLVQAAQRALDHLSHYPLKILNGCWSQNYDQTRNFSYTLAGSIPACDLLAIKTQLCKPFQGSPTDLVLASGWSWAQLRNVPMVNKHSNVWTAEDLYHSIANPCFSDALICVPPHWQGTPLTSGKDFTTVFVAYIDNSMEITQCAMLEGISMFGAQVKFIHCGDIPTLVQCGCCHMLDHHVTLAKCKISRDKVKCYRCRGAHDGQDHNYECPHKHQVPGKCDCSLKCLLCGTTGHHCHSPKCPKQGAIGVPKLTTPALADKPGWNVTDEC
jgi:hypothetical protein